jgi:GNAT superfamily N-acetyltransferase
MSLPLAPALEAERNEVEAMTDLGAAASGSAAAPYLRTWRQGPDGCVTSMPSLPFTLFNRVWGWGLEAGPDEAVLADLWQRLGPQSSPRFGIQPAPGPLGDAWRDALRTLGYLPRLQSLVQMVRDLGAEPEPAASPAPGLDVREVDPARPAEVAAFARTAATGFGLPDWFADWLARVPGRPGWHPFVAWRDGEPVGAAALHVHGARGWLGIATTLPAARRLGVQRSLMQARLARATALGCRIATTETGAPEPGKPHPSYSNMLGCGFRLAATRTTWARPA